MRSWQENEQLMQRFRAWLSETDAEAGAAQESGARSAVPEVGLLQLVEAFTSLRHEMKLQTKSSRSLVESLATALTALDNAARQFRSVEPREAEMARQAARPLVESLIGLDEALQRGLNTVEASRNQSAQQAAAATVNALDQQLQQMSAWRRWCYRGWHGEMRRLCRQRIVEKVWEEIDVHLEGYRLICSRMERELSQHKIQRIKCLGEVFDPARMNVVGLANSARLPPRTVVEEVRPGYLWRSKVVRFAEVRVVRDRTDAVGLDQLSGASGVVDIPLSLDQTEG
jgi:molecular chaperone GrpE (heat shock protein)